MQIYRPIRDDDEARCPYCGGDRRELHDQIFSVDDRPYRCDECRKFYYVRQEFKVTHVSSPDCSLNNTEHSYVILRPIGGLKRAPYCERCGKTKPLIDD